MPEGDDRVPSQIEFGCLSVLDMQNETYQHDAMLWTMMHFLIVEAPAR